jgi:hypothetical protein
MRRFVAATSGWLVGAIASVLLAVAFLASPTAAASLNHNLTATARYSASSYWDSDQNSTTFIADKAFDGDLNTRWNGYTGTGVGEWLAAQWDSPVTMNHVVVREAFDRIDGFRVQRFDTATKAWVDVAVVEVQEPEGEQHPEQALNRSRTGLPAIEAFLPAGRGRSAAFYGDEQDRNKP